MLCWRSRLRYWSSPESAESRDADEPPDASDSASPHPGDDADVGESTDAGGRSKSERTGAPPGYRKVMRFLENRQLPMDREEAEGLAADAYEMDEDAVAAAIDHAIEYGRLREVSGELKR